MVWLLLLCVRACLGGKETAEDLAHYIITNPTTDHPYNSAEKRVYKIIEDAIVHWNTAPETEPPTVDSEGEPLTMTPEPRAPRWWNQYMQEKYGDPPVFPDWSNETQVEQYLKNKPKKKEWTPSQESFEPMRPDEEPFTWVPATRDPEVWTQPPWNSTEIKILGDRMLKDAKYSGGSYGSYYDTDYKEGVWSNSTEESHETRTATGANKTAKAVNPGGVGLRGRRQNLWLQQSRFRPARFRSRRDIAERTAALKPQLLPHDLVPKAAIRARRLAALQRAGRSKKNQELRKSFNAALVKKMDQTLLMRNQQGSIHRRQYKGIRRRQRAGLVMRV